MTVKKKHESEISEFINTTDLDEKIKTLAIKA